MRALVSVKFFWFLSEYFWISSWIDFGFLYENLLDFWVKSFGFWVKSFGFLGEIFWIFWWFFTLSSLVAQWQWVAIGDSRIVKEALLLIIATSLSTLPPANFLLHWLSKKGGRGANPGWGMREKLNLFDPAPSLQHENHNHHCKSLSIHCSENRAACSWFTRMFVWSVVKTNVQTIQPIYFRKAHETFIESSESWRSSK